MSEFSEQKLEKLILLIQQHPCLYDMTQSSYRNKCLKARAWEEIGGALNIDGSSCQRKWKILKDRYGRSCLPPKSGSAGGYRSEWSLKKNMEFIKPFCQSRSTSSNVSDAEKRPAEEIGLLLVNEEPQCSSWGLQSATSTVLDWTDESNSSASASTLASPKDEVKPKRRTKKRNDCLDTKQILEELRNPNVGAQDDGVIREDDEVDLFFSALAAKAKKLSPKKRSKLELKYLLEMNEMSFDSD